MRLAEIIELRPVPAAGLLATLTRRCPLSCAHCSTSSGPRGEDTPAAALRRFVGGFTAGDRPEVLMLTGGEPLLRPALVGDLAELAASAGTRTSVLSGMFFATEGPVPDRIMRALRHVAHFSASIDVFHEREVPRAAVFRAVHHIMDSGIDVSFHVVGNSVDDPYLADITASIRAEFRDQAAVLVNHVRQVGRAAGWAAARTVPLRGAGEQALEWARDGAGEGAAAEGWPAPCAMAAWPVVAFDGTVAACCNQRVVDARPLPEHLRLGHIAVDDWPRIRRRCQESPVLRTIRTAGVGSCASCRTLARRPAALTAAERAGSRPAAGAMDALGARLQRDAGAAALLRRYGSERYAPLVMLDGRESGRESGREAGCATGRGTGCGTGRDAGPETGREAGCGSSRDAGPGTGREAGCETSCDAGGEPGRETGDEASRRTGSADTHAPECGRQGGREGGCESGRESGREYEEGGGPA